MTTFLLATCQDCTPVLPQPFTSPDARALWAAHRTATGHKVIYSTGDGYAADLSAGRVPGTGRGKLAVTIDPADEARLEQLSSFWLRHNHSEIVPCVAQLCPGYQALAGVALVPAEGAVSITADLKDPASARNAAIALGLGDVVPASVLEALASAWEDQALRPPVTGGLPGQRGLFDRESLLRCAEMLRDAITHGAQG